MFSFIKHSRVLNLRIFSTIIQENNGHSLVNVINKGINQRSLDISSKCARHTLVGVKSFECSNLLYTQCQPILQQNRNYRTQRSRGNRNASSDDTSPDLMDFPWIIWPSLFNTIKNWIFANLIIRPYFDGEFSLKSFKEGSKQALVAVSEELSKGNFEELQPFVDLDALGDLKRNFTAMSIKQRMDLAVAKEDIFFSFPHEIGVIFKNEGSQIEQIFVEITMCFHVFRGFEDHIREQAKANAGVNETVGIKSVYKNIDRISIANYRFIREFTKGVEDDWTVNLLNHFKPGEHLQKKG